MLAVFFSWFWNSEFAFKHNFRSPRDYHECLLAGGKKAEVTLENNLHTPTCYLKDQEFRLDFLIIENH